MSASENQRLVLDAVDLTSAFDTLVDGALARRLGLAGKPDPALFLEATERLAATPGRSVVVSDLRELSVHSDQNGRHWLRHEERP